MSLPCRLPSFQPRWSSQFSCLFIYLVIGFSSSHSKEKRMLVREEMFRVVDRTPDQRLSRMLFSIIKSIRIENKSFDLWHLIVLLQESSRFSYWTLAYYQWSIRERNLNLDWENNLFWYLEWMDFDSMEMNVFYR